MVLDSMRHIGIESPQTSTGFPGSNLAPAWARCPGWPVDEQSAVFQGGFCRRSASCKLKSSRSRGDLRRRWHRVGAFSRTQCRNGTFLSPFPMRGVLAGVTVNLISRYGDAHDRFGGTIFNVPGTNSARQQKKQNINHVHRSPMTAHTA